MQGSVNKVLIIRFSSIGDIVLTTPVIRSLKMARPECEIHFLTKKAYGPLLEHNPHLHRIHFLEDSFRHTARLLTAETFDHILDLHNNLRSLRVKWALRTKSSTFHKENLAKYRLVRQQKYPSEWLPHVVTRYGATLAPLGVELDAKGLDIFYPTELDSWARKKLASLGSSPLAVVLGAKFNTKRWLPEYFVETINRLGRPVLLLGGSDATTDRDAILPQLQVASVDAVNQYSLLESTALLNQAEEVLSHDTGFMHIAAALGKKVYSLWGNTVPALGMTPYNTESVILENTDITCRPCSKIGFEKCPKGHFDCMVQLTPDWVVEKLTQPTPSPDRN